MCNQLTVGTLGGFIGLNIFANAIGQTPPSPLLANIVPTFFTLMRTADFNYLSFISTMNNLGIQCRIHDILF